MPENDPLILVERLRNDITSEILARENRLLEAVEKKVEGAVETAVTRLLVGPFREQTCPFRASEAKVGEIIRQHGEKLDDLSESVEGLHKTLLNGGGGVVPRLEARVRDVELGLKEVLPFRTPARSRGSMPREESGEQTQYRDRKVDAVPTGLKGFIGRIPLSVWLILGMHVITVLVLFAALANAPQMDNLERIIRQIRQEQAQGTTP